MAALLREVVSLVLVVGLIVTGTALLVMFTGPNGARHRHRHHRDTHNRHDSHRPVHVPPPGPRPSPLTATPSSAVAAARARALAAAEQILPLEPPVTEPPELLALPPAPTPPAGQPPEEPDVPQQRLDPSAEELRSAIDHLIEHNPDFLAEVITTWIRDDSGTQRPTPRPPSVARRPLPRRH